MVRMRNNLRYISIDETYGITDEFISFYSKSLKNHCSRNKMKTKRKEKLLLASKRVYVIFSVTTRENHDFITSSSSRSTVG